MTVVAAGLPAGCATTQQTAARLQLNDARIRASQLPTKVSPAQVSRRVRLLSLSVIGRRAIVVTVRNDGSRPVADLPISVGYTHAGTTSYLNSAANAQYFANHLPALSAHRPLAWVYLASRPLPAGARPFARIGARPTPAAPIASLPALRTKLLRAAGGQLELTVTNPSGIPQYQLPVYAFASDGGRLTAAATETIAELDPGTSRTLHLTLIGSASAGLSTVAVPTIFN